MYFVRGDFIVLRCCKISVRLSVRPPDWSQVTKIYTDRVHKVVNEDLRRNNRT